MINRRLIRIKVAQELYSHIKSDEKNIARTTKELLVSTQKCYELYLLLLTLIGDVQNYAQSRIDIRKNKLRPTAEDQNPKLNFVENNVIFAIKESVELEKAIGKLSFGDHENVIKELYNNLIESDFYIKYMEIEEPTFAENKKLVVDFYKKLIEDNELLEILVEEISIFWTDNISYALGFAIQTIKDIKQNDMTLKINELFQNKTDKEYAITLLQKSIINQAKYLEIIDQITKNWDLERIAFMDKVLMVEAMTEMVEFESIPVKSTLDEFIEIAKFYSTPQSATFINGVLDKAVEMLKNDIKKSGRGLI